MGVKRKDVHCGSEIIFSEVDFSLNLLLSFELI